MLHQHSLAEKVLRGKPKNQNQNQNENPTDEIGLNGFSSASEEPQEPKKRRGRQPGSVSTKAQGETLKRIETGFSGMIQGAATMMRLAGGKLASDGQIIALHEKNLTASVVELCRQDKRAREFMLSLTTGSAYANVVVACVPIVIAILANHNMLPPIFGISPMMPQTAQPPIPNGLEHFQVA